MDAIQCDACGSYCDLGDAATISMVKKVDMLEMIRFDICPACQDAVKRALDSRKKPSV